MTKLSLITPFLLEYKSNKQNVKSSPT